MIGITNAGGRKGDWRVNNVYGGMSAPANPEQFDIFINTSIPLLSGEITANVQGKPSWDANQGMWYISIITGTYSGGPYGHYFAQNRRNGHSISGFPGQAWQRINGQWWPMNAYAWYNGQWVQFSWSWDGTLWGPNNQYTDHTGGWGYASSNANAPYFGEFIRWSCDNTTIFLYTNRAVDVTNFSRLRYDGQMWGETSFGLSNKNGVLNGSNWVARVTGNGTVYNGIVDISGISGSFYITAYASSEGGSGAQFNKIWLE